MRDANELLKQKEAELDRVRHEVESLRLAADLLAEKTMDHHENNHSSVERELDQSASEATGTDGMFSSATPSRPRFWRITKRGK
jgi:hypothetical protein